MFSEIFDRRVPLVAAADWKPNANETKRLHKVARRDRTPSELVCSLVIFQSFLDECGHTFDDLARTGLMHQIDQIRLQLALAPAMNEEDINLKMAFLSGVEPCIINNINLSIIASAAIAADKARLLPVQTAGYN